MLKNKIEEIKSLAEKKIADHLIYENSMNIKIAKYK